MRRSGSSCYQCQYDDICFHRHGLRNLLDTLERNLVFSDIGGNDNPRREFIELLSNWCYWFKGKEAK